MKTCPQCQQEYATDVDFCPADGNKLRAKRDVNEDPLIGRALDGRWVIEEKLGEGGMGAVYRGHQKSVSRTVAIKTLRPQLVDSEEFVDRFFREAKIAATISHPNSVTILDYGESEDGTLYLAMEFLEGELLTDRIESGRLTIRQVVEIGIQVASALSAAHDNHIVHRDLKPDNIFLLDVPGNATFVKVLDFGIAKMLDSKTQVTKTGMIFGTPEYMSPEQCRGDKIDGRADLYSLGCILYELIGGRTPFRGTTPMAVLMAHVNEAAPALVPATSTAAQVPYEVDQVIMRLLEKKPENRFSGAAELRETLEAVLGSLENPGASVSRELLKPLPSREIIGPEVNIGFDATMGINAGTVQERREQTTTDTMAEAELSKSRAPFMVLGVLVVLIAIAGAFVRSMTRSAEPEVAPPIPAVAVEEPAPTPAPAVVVEVEQPAKAEPEEPVTAELVAAEPEAQGVAAAEVEPPARKTRSKKAKAVKQPEPEPAVEPTPKAAEPVKTQPVADKVEETPTKSKTKRPVAEKVNKKAEKVRDDIKKGADKALENVLGGLMD